jgi:acyl-CoA thioesterase FadM
VRYAHAARYDDPIRVVTHVAAAQSRTITFAYEIYREDNPPQLLATATTKLIAIDERGVPRRLPPALLQRFRESSIPD